MHTHRIYCINITTTTGLAQFVQTFANRSILLSRWCQPMTHGWQDFFENWSHGFQRFSTPWLPFDFDPVPPSLLIPHYSTTRCVSVLCMSHSVCLIWRQKVQTGDLVPASVRHTLVDAKDTTVQRELKNHVAMKIQYPIAWLSLVWRCQTLGARWRALLSSLLSGTLPSPNSEWSV